MVFWAMPSTYLKGTAAAGGIALINSIGLLGGEHGGCDLRQPAPDEMRPDLPVPEITPSVPLTAKITKVRLPY